MILDKKAMIIILVIIVTGLISFSVGYTFLGNSNSELTPKNISSINSTLEDGKEIPYSSEYITFDKAESIAKKYAKKSVNVDNTILIKNKAGQAIYICYYYYQGNYVGGAIINAKTGKVLYYELNLPSTYSYDDSTGNGADYSSEYSPSTDYTTNACDVCDGDGWVYCSTCDGYGYDEEGNDCSYCSGQGWYYCENCGGDGEVNI